MIIRGYRDSAGLLLQHGLVAIDFLASDAHTGSSHLWDVRGVILPQEPAPSHSRSRPLASASSREPNSSRVTRDGLNLSKGRLSPRVAPRQRRSNSFGSRAGQFSTTTMAVGVVVPAVLTLLTPTNREPSNDTS